MKTCGITEKMVGHRQVVKALVMRKFARTFISDLGKGIEVFSEQQVEGGRAVVWHG